MLINEERNAYARENTERFPIKSVFSLRPLIDRFWNNHALNENQISSDFAKRIIEELKKAPELLEPITDISILKKHEHLFDALMAAVFLDRGEDGKDLLLARQEVMELVGNSGSHRILSLKLYHHIGLTGSAGRLTRLI